ncbi:MAG: nucleoside-triphosphatase [Candidatus Hodarchaeales archaeon]
MMKTSILITGPPRSGKTTLITRLLRRIVVPVSGFYTREITSTDNRRTGFEIRCLDGTTGILALVGEKYPAKFGRYSVNLAAIRELMVPRMLEPEGLFILDEIGKMELICSEFRNLIPSLLARGNLIATISLKDTPDTTLFKKHPNVVLFTLSIHNRNSVLVQVIDLVNSLEI